MYGKLNGGAIYNGDENGVASNPHLEGCQFLDNGLAQGLGDVPVPMGVGRLELADGAVFAGEPMSFRMVASVDARATSDLFS